MKKNREKWGWWGDSAKMGIITTIIENPKTFRNTAHFPKETRKAAPQNFVYSVHLSLKRIDFIDKFSFSCRGMKLNTSKFHKFI